MTDLVWLYSSKILSMIVGLVVMVFYYNYLGPENIGLLSYVSVLLFYFGLIANDPSIQNVAIRHESEAVAENRNGYFTASFIFKIVVSIISWVALMIYSRFLDSNERIIAYMLGASLLFAPFGVFNSVLEYEQKFRLIAQIDMLIVVLNNLAIVLCVYLKTGIAWFALVQAFFLVLRNLVLAAVSFRSSFKINITDAYSNIRLLLRGYWPLFLSGILVLSYTRIDQIMIRHYQGLYYLGIYALVIGLIEKVSFIPLVLTSYLYPKFAKLKSDEDFIQFTSKVANVVLPFMALFVVFSILFARDIGNLFAKNYPTDIFSPAFIISSFAFVGIFSGCVFGRIIILFDAQKRQTLMYAIMLAVNAVLNFLLIPRYSIIGAAIAASITQCSITILPYFLIPKMKSIYKLLLRKFLVFWVIIIVLSILLYSFGRNNSIVFKIGICAGFSFIVIYMSLKSLQALVSFRDVRAKLC